MAVAKSRDPHARRLKLRATGCESRLRGLIEPASAGFVDVAEGFSPTASDVATAMPAPTELFDNPALNCYTPQRRGCIAQLGERDNRTVEVRGSNPRASTIVRGISSVGRAQHWQC